MGGLRERGSPGPMRTATWNCTQGEGGLRERKGEGAGSQRPQSRPSDGGRTRRPPQGHQANGKDVPPTADNDLEPG